jgi:hypothetical protein
MSSGANLVWKGIRGGPTTAVWLSLFKPPPTLSLPLHWPSFVFWCPVTVAVSRSGGYVGEGADEWGAVRSLKTLDYCRSLFLARFVSLGVYSYSATQRSWLPLATEGHLLDFRSQFFFEIQFICSYELPGPMGDASLTFHQRSTALQLRDQFWTIRLA